MNLNILESCFILMFSEDSESRCSSVIPFEIFESCSVFISVSTFFESVLMLKSDAVLCSRFTKFSISRISCSMIFRVCNLRRIVDGSFTNVYLLFTTVGFVNGFNSTVSFDSRTKILSGRSER